MDEEEKRRSSTTYSAPAIGRAFRVIEFLAVRQSAKFREVQDELNIAKSSTHLVLKNLEILGYIYRDADANYRLSPKFHNLGNKSLGNQASHEAIIAVAKKHLFALRDATGFAVHLATLEGTNVLYLDKIEANEFVRFDTFVGKKAPVHLTAVGRAILTLLDEPMLKTLLSSLDFSTIKGSIKFTTTTFRRRIGEFKKQGFAIEREEESPGVECLAAPIMTSQLKQFYSIGIISLTVQMKDKDHQKLARLLIKTARDITREIEGA